MKKKIFGLLGRGIGYSFSKKYFSEKFKTQFLHDHSYEVFDIDSLESLPELLREDRLKGFNVTIPYKEQIIPLLDEVSSEAALIGAVNTVKIREGKAVGYNTDAYGFEKTLLLHKKPHHTHALILGNGGASKAVQYVLKKHGIAFETVSRSLELNYHTLPKELVSTHPLIVQTTPVGTFPMVNDCLDFPFEALSSNHLVIDLIYNPTFTAFMDRAAEHGAKCVNGYFMLEQQAEKAWEIWNAE